MEFSRIGEHTIKCVISEEEIYDLGYTMDEIMSNGERTQEFMNQIFDMASEEFGTDFNSGIKTVRADFLADHTLSLTFSEHPATEGMQMISLQGLTKGLFLWSMQRLFLMIRLLRVLRSCEGTEQLQKYNKTRSVSYTDRPCFICKYYPSTFLIDSITRSA